MLISILMHLILLGLAVVIVVAPFRSQKNEPARYRDLWWWLAVSVIPLFILPFLSFYPLENHFFAYALAFFCLVMGILGAMSTIWRTESQRPRARPVGAVIATSILSLLFAALFLPAMTPAREAAVRQECRNHLKLIGLAIHRHYNALRVFPMASSGQGELAVSWRVTLEPYLDAHQIDPKYSDQFAWNAEPNWAFSKRRRPVYECPAAGYRRADPKDGFGLTDYVVLVGDETAFPQGKMLLIQNIEDGLSNTAFVVEAIDTGIRWAEPKDLDVNQVELVVKSSNTNQQATHPIMSSAHSHGSHILLGDGSVRFISSQISPEILRMLTTASAGDVIRDE
ncbi:protein of unknown function DUF1559 [Planctopirus limnophila DSM 3776]|uniref:DUF1559 domain-containing protein n=1 Tax=Planctopirus limnophila (strain ATCC 43296 / DSM 3776 / IFAM 1008 / Mu 290) TaxID=521674 RepID=D5SPL2_PLAL2|nr:DUF1559 domain-containing protein [Planctopirus limnophila]ADG66242.1 protein of unknown function DUF1559 [Planctopirus limnophila DSM 3776]